MKLRLLKIAQHLSMVFCLTCVSNAVPTLANYESLVIQATEDFDQKYSLSFLPDCSCFFVQYMNQLCGFDIEDYFNSEREDAKKENKINQALQAVNHNLPYIQPDLFKNIHWLDQYSHINEMSSRQVNNPEFYPLLNNLYRSACYLDLHKYLFLYHVEQHLNAAWLLKSTTDVSDSVRNAQKPVQVYAYKLKTTHAQKSFHEQKVQYFYDQAIHLKTRIDQMNRFVSQID